MWRRFPVRLAALFGVFVLIAVTGSSVAFTGQVIRARQQGLQDRLRDLASAATLAVDADEVAELAQAPEEWSPAHVLTQARLAGLLDADPSVNAIYVLLPTERPGHFRFFIEASRDGGAGLWGTPYDGTTLPVMLQGLSALSVEREPVADAYGVTQSGYAPVRDTAGEVVALVGVDVDAGDIAAARARVLRISLAIYLAAILFLGAAAVVVARSVREPLVQVISASGAIARGESGVRLAMPRQDEFGVLGRHFDLMAAGLEEREFIRATFGRYVSEDVARMLLETPGALNPGGEEREVTILFSDLRGYSTISERLAPSQIVEMLNSYMGAMADLVDGHGGCVIEFLGDAVLAVFGAPVSLPNHPEHAVRCALAMRERLGELNLRWAETTLSQAWRAGGMDSLGMRIGIHTGSVVAGNLGSASRMKYAVIGDSVNVASRLETLNKTLDTSLLVSDVTLQRLPPDLARLATDRGEHEVKGRAQLVRVWSY